MHDRARDIARKRHLVVIVLRSIAVLMLIRSAYCLVNMMVVSYPWRQLSDFLVYWDAGRGWTGQGVGLLIVGGLVLWQAKRLAAWIVPAWRRECPQCGYSVENSDHARCPECGYVLREGARGVD